MPIEATRIKPLNAADIPKGDYVLYWMQQSQRATYNHALEYAVRQANNLDLMLLVVFGLTDDYLGVCGRYGIPDDAEDVTIRRFRVLKVTETE